MQKNPFESQSKTFKYIILRIKENDKTFKSKA